MNFKILRTWGRARAGQLSLPDKQIINTPVFMPVGTQATVKTLEIRDLNNLGVKILLNNAYHLYLRPGMKIVDEAGGLHNFMNWKGGLITDSGGYQVFSLNSLRRLKPEGIHFTSHLDGSSHLFTPESNMILQHALGADIIMTLDVCAAYPSPDDEIKKSVELTTDWAGRCLAKHEELGGKQALFGIIQGGVIRSCRETSTRELTAMNFPGYGIGGLSVGEGPVLMNEVLDILDPLLPEEKPRYLMGVGTPQDLWDAVARGVDMFDCAMPTRIARNGTLYTSQGRLVIKNAAYARDWSPPDPRCACPLCSNHSRAYLRHLFKAREITALRLSTLHNLTFMLNLSDLIRNAILSGDFEETKREFMDRYKSGDVPE
ncbi:tRNA guanosine(34) transglycosylase Tgt [bacterium]|nr:tRNA guanosine(34) transglycosylase Tgt [bacterium]